MKITHCQMVHLDKPMGYHLGTPVVSWLIETADGEKKIVCMDCVYKHVGKEKPNEE